MSFYLSSLVHATTNCHQPLAIRDLLLAQKNSQIFIAESKDPQKI